MPTFKSMPVALKLAIGAQVLAGGWSAYKRAPIPAIAAGISVVAMLVAWKGEAPSSPAKLMVV